MDSVFITFLVIGVILAIVGVVGAVVPVVPGPPIAFCALLCPYFTTEGKVSTTTVVIMLIVTIAVTALDYLFPVWFTKAGGGSKMATWGATLGLIGGLLFAPVGPIIGPFLGALVGELLHDNSNFLKALKVAGWSFLSFLVTTGMKLVCTLVLAYFTLSAYWDYIPPIPPVETWFK